MPPNVALLLTLCLIVYLFRYDRRTFPQPTSAVWIPLLWVSLAGSRFVSEWLNISSGAAIFGASRLEEGSPIDRVVFFGLILVAILILMSRKATLGHVISENPALVLFLGYCLVSILWSDYSFVVFKRWIKVLGHPIMALVLLTEPQPEESIKTLFRRVAYILVPLSITFIKYFPAWGRGFDQWTGMSVNTGVTTNKNLLGCLCLVLGLFFVWMLLTRHNKTETPGQKTTSTGVILALLFLGAILWLFQQAQSGTSLLCFLIGCGVLLLLQSRALKMETRLLGAYVIGGILLLAIFQMIGASDLLIAALGKDATLTGRTELWTDILSLADAPIFGVGFETFWLGPRMITLQDKYWWQPNQAHNGYIETYINLGAIGIFLLAVAIVSTYRKARASYAQQVPLATLWLTYLLAILLYNFTEASFKALHLLFFLFFLTSVGYWNKQNHVLSQRVATGNNRVSGRNPLETATQQKRQPVMKRGIPPAVRKEPDYSPRRIGTTDSQTNHEAMG